MNNLLRKMIGLFGAMCWSAVVLLRSMGISGSLIGVLPNLGAALLVCYLIDVILFKNTKFKMSMLISLSVFIMAFISEVIHDLYLDSPFDKLDIYMTLLALSLYLLVSKIELNMTEKT